MQRSRLPIWMLMVMVAAAAFGCAGGRLYISRTAWLRRAAQHRTFELRIGSDLRKINAELVREEALWARLSRPGCGTARRQFEALRAESADLTTHVAEQSRLRRACESRWW
jgi:hypothetical protein